jgi:hypothetical protein
MLTNSTSWHWAALKKTALITLSEMIDRTHRPRIKLQLIIASSFRINQEKTMAKGQQNTSKMVKKSKKKTRPPSLCRHRSTQRS